MYYLSSTSTQLSVLASDLVLGITRYVFHFMARPRSEPSPVSSGKIQIIEIQESVSQDYKDTSELLGKMTILVQTISKVSCSKRRRAMGATGRHKSVLTFHLVARCF